MNVWDQRFNTADGAFLYGLKPNVWLEGRLPQLPKASRVLALADGEGRNAAWLAQQGYVVSNWDYSQVGLDKTQHLAAQIGCVIDTKCVDLTQCDWPVGCFDAVVSSFFHVPKVFQKTVWQGAVSALKPGGHLVVQVFSESQLSYHSGGPKDINLLYRCEELQCALSGMRVLTLSEDLCPLDEGHLHQGLASVINLHAIKEG